MISDKLILIAGPCVIENREVPFEVAEELVRITKKLDFELIFKSSYKKANRTSLISFTGLGTGEGLRILSEIKSYFDIPILTDIHESKEVEEVSRIADYLQIPAFLCRQTDLLMEAGRSGRWVNIKKGQFLSPEAMKFALDKVKATGNKKIMLTERGSLFGYHDLVVDFRSIPIMKSYKVPVIVDCTHSLQQPNQKSGVTGGKPELIETIALAAVATGADGLFIETHPSPSSALSDGANMLAMDKLESLLIRVNAVRQVVKEFKKTK